MHLLSVFDGIEEKWIIVHCLQVFGKKRSQATKSTCKIRSPILAGIIKFAPMQIAHKKIIKTYELVYNFRFYFFVL